MSAAPLLAKSARGPAPLTLEDHSLQTQRAARAIFSPARRMGGAWLRFFGLAAADGPRFLLHLEVAALLHDLGKANAEFQAMVSGGAAAGQSLRHEHISGLLLFLPEVRAWLAAAVDVDVVAAAVLSHHCKVAPAGPRRWCQPRGARVVPLALDHREVAAVLTAVGAACGLGPAPRLPAGAWSPTGAWEAAWQDGMDAHEDFPLDGPRHRLSLAVKAGLVAADTAASGLIREGLDLEGWIEAHLHLPALGPAQIEADILAPRAAAISRASGRPFAYQRFQDEAAKLGPRGLLLAACGTGKTLAAWRWAAGVSAHRPAGRVVFLYPTRGTATEGFRDYVGWAPEGTAELLHGTAAWDLHAMMANPPESLAGKEVEADETEARLFALRLWDKRYFSATVDQFLGFLEHQYRGLCLLPVLADALLVIDEAHALDSGLFRKLLAFVERFDLPLLCMTATLPPKRREALERRGLEVCPSAALREELADLREEEERPRYRVEALADVGAALPRAVAAHAAGQRVLWVCNTVRRCQEVALALRDRGLAPLVYHSRFTLRDRQRQHAATVAAFQQRARPALAVATQVCEMSLDLDADVIITEHAPPTALVQRMGRANRSRARPRADRGLVLHYPPEAAAPYAPAELRAGAALLAALGAEPSQAALAAALEHASPEERAADAAAGFLDGGLFAEARGFREGDGFTQQAVLAADLREAVDRCRRRAPLTELLLPAPRALVTSGAGLPPWCGLVAAPYDPELGLLPAPDGGAA